MTVARAAIGTFVLFYGAAEAIAGIATGTLVRYASDLPQDAQAAAAGAPLAACVLLALSAIAVFHAPPTGPIGLLFLAGAVVLLACSQRARRPRGGHRRFRDGYRNGAGAVGVHPALVNQITRRTR